MSLKQLSDSAYWMAYMRAVEDERPDALFRDPYSRQLAGEQGELIARRLGSVQMISSSIAIRTAALDRMLLDRIASTGVDLVLNLGAGLDTRPWRLALPPTLTWLDVDLRDVLDYKAHRLGDRPAACQYRSLSANILEVEQRKSVLRECGDSARVMVLTEGLLVYLRPGEVAALGRDLYEHSACQWWLTDLVGPRALQRLQQEWEPKVGNAQFHFAPADASRFFAQLGWRETEFHSSSQESVRLRRVPPLPWIARLVMALGPASEREAYRRLAGISVLERDSLPTKDSSPDTSQ